MKNYRIVKTKKMIIRNLLEHISHPLELKAAIKLWFFKKPLYSIKASQNFKDLIKCYEILQKTSRSFSYVIKEVHPELLDTIALFYLILRALDTIEDNMKIEQSRKIPLLRNFHKNLELEHWNFTENLEGDTCGVVLVEFDCILREYHKLKPEYQKVIKDITDRMGNGMADYILDTQFKSNGPLTLKDYDMYCYYVAGLVGDGLTHLIVLAEFADPEVYYESPELYRSMGLFLQKVNIIRDYAEDLRDSRFFWPKEIWSKYADDLSSFPKPENAQNGVYCINNLVLDSLSHVQHILIYLSSIKEQSIFQFCAIPQVMAVATLALVFNNKDVLYKNVKIRRGTACYLILKSRTYAGCVKLFKHYLHDIRSKCAVDDPNYLKLNIQISKLDQFVEGIFQNKLPPSVQPRETLIYSKAKERSMLEVEVVSKEQDEEFKFNMLFSMLITILAAFYYFII